MSVIDDNAIQAQLEEDERQAARRRKIESVAIPIGTLILL